MTGVVDISDIPDSVEKACYVSTHHMDIAGVLSVAVDVPLTVATVAQALKLPGLSFATAQLGANKWWQKTRLQAAGIPVPWFTPVETLTQLRDVVQTCGNGLVLKPVDSRGSRGVIRLLPAVDLAWAWQQARAETRHPLLLVEQWESGPQISTESVILAGQCYTPGFIDRNYSFLDRYAPYVLEDGATYPSLLSPSQQEDVYQLLAQTAQALGMQYGTLKGDVVWTPTGPKIIEVAPRLSGGWFCTQLIPWATGVDLVAIALKLATGQPVTPEECRPQFQRGCAIRYLWPDPGVVTATSDAAVHQLPQDWEGACHIFVRVGSCVASPTRHSQRAGCAVMLGETREEAVARARAVVAAMLITTTPAEEHASWPGTT